MSWDTILASSAPAATPVVFAVGDAELDLELVPDGASTVADVIEALAGGTVAAGTVLRVDGRLVDIDAAVGEAGLRPGSRVELAPPGAAGPDTTPPPATPALVVVHAVGGVDAGATWRLPAGRWAVGRAPEADVRLEAPTVSSQHLEVAVDSLGGVTISDLGSRNGTRLEGAFITTSATAWPPGALLQVGAVQLVWAPSPTGLAAPHRRSAGIVPFNRPPRPAPPGEPEPIAVPETAAEPAARARLAVAAMIAPLVMGGAMALLWDPRMALFAALTPVAMAGSWIEDRRRVRRERRHATAALEVELRRFDADLDREGHEHIARRRASLADPATAASRATSVSTDLWQRRAHHHDALQLRLGTADVPWTPPLGDTRRAAEGVADVLARHARLERAPVEVDLRPGRVLGVVGDDRAAVASLIRSLVVQAATAHGPADLRIAVLTDADRVDGWSWAKWLPHTAGAGPSAGLRLLAASPGDVATVVGALVAMAPPRDAAGMPERLVVVDADGLTEGRPSPVRSLLGGASGPVAGIVVAADPSRLPALCTTVVELTGPDGIGRTFEPATNAVIEDVLVAGMSEPVARAASTALASVEDPEVREAGASLPDRVGLLPLLGMDAAVDDVVARWHRPDLTLRTAIGVTEEGPLVLDLVADGPHGLIGGTTGAGKSELLRTLVVGLAANASPEHLNFVLIDYKGGSAFDACARLPHTVGMVTDLDEHLGQRALRCLDAELRHREAVLRAAGATDLAHHQTLRPHVNLPRLVVVIDEFATLAAELPDFIDALVGVAQRGRSLGVHLMLATQRPAGAVKDNIRANTNLRIALRMQDAADSTDVIDVAAAAAIGRRQAGRGYVRLGPSEVVPFQAAIVSQPAPAGSSAAGAVQLRPIPFGPDRRDDRDATSAGVGPTDLERLVGAIVEANGKLAIAPPRRPWPEPLPEAVALADGEVDLPRAGRVPSAVLGLADDPLRQRRVPATWDAADGNLLLYGIAGSGTTTTLDTIARSLAGRHRPEDVHLYVLDFGAGELGSLASLPHVGAVITASDTERQTRLLRLLRAELDRRRAMTICRDDEPAIVLLLDNWSGFAGSFDELASTTARDEMARLVADGPALGVWTVITADQANAVPLAIANLVPCKLVFRLADRHDLASFGFSAATVLAPHPGRCLQAPSMLEVQVARAAGMGHRSGARTARPIAVLPSAVPIEDVHTAVGDGHELFLPIGIGDESLAPDGLVLRGDDHALVSGPARSGKSTTLRTIADVLAHRAPHVHVHALAPRITSPLRGLPGWVATPEALAIDAEGVHVVLVDDAESLDDPLGTMAAMFGAHRPGVHVVAAGRADALRSAYGHWTREVRRSRQGVALRPEPEDGELFGAAFPRRERPAPLPGRGYLVVDGEPRVVQVASS